MKFLIDLISKLNPHSKQNLAKAEAAKDKANQTDNTGKIIAAKVISVEKHPNADRLRVVSLDTGSGIVEPVVCGAFNFEVGDIVALALPGATIPQNIHSENHESFVLGTAKIRGIESQGMICAEFELGLTSELGDKPEIMLLPKDTPLGKIVA